MGVPACPPEYPGAGRSGMLRRTRPVSGVSELYPVRPGAKPWKAADDGREGGILHKRALSDPRIQAGEGWLPPFRPRGTPPETRQVHPLVPRTAEAQGDQELCTT